MKATFKEIRNGKIRCYEECLIIIDGNKSNKFLGVYLAKSIFELLAVWLHSLFHL